VTKLFRFAASGALSGTARVLGLAARVTEQVALAMRPQPDDPHPPGPVGPLTDDDIVEAVEAERDAYDRAWPPGPDAPEPVRAIDEPALDELDEIVVAPAAPDRQPVPDLAAVRAPDDAASGTHARRAESHAAALADRPATDVVEAIKTLSTDELRELYDYESARKKRKSVLGGIERALRPDGAVVHTTETPE
jgi:hypothetical protein